MENSNTYYNTISDLIFNYCKKETTIAESVEITQPKPPVKSSLIKEDDPLMYYMSVSG